MPHHLRLRLGLRLHCPGLEHTLRDREAEAEKESVRESVKDTHTHTDTQTHTKRQRERKRERKREKERDLIRGGRVFRVRVWQRWWLRLGALPQCLQELHVSALETELTQQTIGT